MLKLADPIRLYTLLYLIPSLRMPKLEAKLCVGDLSKFFDGMTAPAVREKFTATAPGSC